MNPERYERIASVFAEVRALPVEQRDPALDRLCGGDVELRAAVEEYLRGDVGGDPALLARPVLEDPALLNRALGTDAEEYPPGSRIGPYTIVERLGEGGFGVVYIADQTGPIRRRVALKVIKPGMDSRAVIARFEQERQALAVMDHPHVAKVFDGGVTALGRPYFVMEHVKGEPITDYCDRKSLSIRERLELFIPVCEAVQHAHHKGIIHRDLKPSNVLVMETEGRAIPKVIDFGIAKAIDQATFEQTVFSLEGHFIGTPEYMSPEQAGGRADIDTRTDVYSLGVMLYELLVGRLPFESSDLRLKGLEEVRRIIREEEPPRPSTRLGEIGDAADRIATARRDSRASMLRELRRELEWVPLKALRKERERRYDSPAALAEDIRRYLDGRPLRAAPESRAYRARKFVRRNRPLVIGVSAVVLALSAGLAGTIWQAREAARQTKLTMEEADAREATTQLFTRAIRSAAYGSESQIGGAEVRVSDVLATLDPLLLESVSSPRVRFELALAVGTAYGAIGMYRDADRVLSFACELSLPSVQRARAQRDLAAMLRIEGTDLDRANKLADDAVHSLAGTDGPLSFDGALAILEQVSVLLARKEQPKAVSLINDLDHRLGALGVRRAEAIGLATARKGEAAQFAPKPDLHEAIRFYQTALEQLSPFRSMFDPDVRDIRANLASALSSAGRNAEAIELFESLLQDAQERYGGDNIVVADMLNNLSVAYIESNRMERGADVIREAIRIYDKHRGESSLSAANARNTLAWALLNTNQNDGVDELLRSAVSVFERADPAEGQFGPAGLRTLRALSNLGVAYERMKKYDAAEDAYRREHEGWTAREEVKDWPYRLSLANWASMRMRQRKWDGTTAKLAHDAYDLFAKWQPDQIDLLAWNYSRVLVNSGQFAEAVEFWRSHLARPGTARWGYLWLAEAQIGIADYAAAEQSLKSVSPDAEPHPGYRGLIALARGIPDIAEALLLRAINDDGLMSKAFERGRFRVALGQCLLKRGELAEAQRQILRGRYLLLRELGTGPFVEEAEQARLEMRQALGLPPPTEPDLLDYLFGEQLELPSLLTPPATDPTSGKPAGDSGM